jgi:hypothetical protein
MQALFVWVVAVVKNNNHSQQDVVQQIILGQKRIYPKK